MLFRPFDSLAVTGSLRLKIHGLNDPGRIQVGGGDEALDVVSTESLTGCCSPSLVRERGGARPTRGRALRALHQLINDNPRQ